MSMYKQGGVAAIETPGKGGRRHQYLTVAQERTFLQPFLERAAGGEWATVAEIQLALEAQLGHHVNKSTLYRLLERSGWQRLRSGSSPPQAKASRTVQAEAVARRKLAEQPITSPSAKRERLSRRYPSDLTDQEWAILEPLLPAAKPGGRPRTSDMREVLNAILYVDRTGCQWRALPRDFPPWPTVWTYFRAWRNDGTWERIHTALREAVRVKQGREPTPSAAIIDSQSVKTSQKGGGADTMEARRSKDVSAIS
jgi:transposase